MGQKEMAITAIGKNRIMIFGPKTDGTYVVEFRTAAGEALAIEPPTESRRYASSSRGTPLGINRPTNVRFRANRTLSRHRRMAGFDPTRT
jgi:hypothetical protein